MWFMYLGVSGLPAVYISREIYETTPKCFRERKKSTAEQHIYAQF